MRSNLFPSVVVQERVAVLESEASSSNIQNAELQHVLTEHISRLESSSVEHEQLVQRYEELRQSQQLIAAAREEEMRT